MDDYNGVLVNDAVEDLYRYRRTGLTRMSGLSARWEA